MALISPEDRQTLQTLFEQELQDDVNIIYFTQRESVLIVPGQECTYCKETRELLRERTNKSLDYLNQQAGKLRESADEIVKKGKEFIGPHRDSVKTDTEAEKQAYEEERRENLGG